MNEEDTEGSKHRVYGITYEYNASFNSTEVGFHFDACTVYSVIAQPRLGSTILIYKYTYVYIYIYIYKNI